eukprot:2880806-Pyramimonas_sp.AAC.1
MSKITFDGKQMDSWSVQRRAVQAAIIKCLTASLTVASSGQSNMFDAAALLEEMSNSSVATGGQVGLEEALVASPGMPMQISEYKVNNKVETLVDVRLHPVYSNMLLHVVDDMLKESTEGKVLLNNMIHYIYEMLSEHTQCSCDVMTQLLNLAKHVQATCTLPDAWAQVFDSASQIDTFISLRTKYAWSLLHDSIENVMKTLPDTKLYEDDNGSELDHIRIMATMRGAQPTEIH